VIELLVVISLIIILVALLINTLIENRGPIVATKATMQALQNAETEYRALTGLDPINHFNYVTPVANNKPIEWGKIVNKNHGPEFGPFPGDNPKTGIPNHSIERFIWVVGQSPDIRQMLRAQDVALTDSDGDGFLEALDGWENKIEYLGWVVHDTTPGGTWTESASPRDPAYEEQFDPGISVGQRLNLRHPEYGSPLKRLPHFASAGRDGRWGNATETDKTSQEYKRTVDDLYSYDIE
jgi:type II secretory pathway pseudopilin PulG